MVSYVCELLEKSGNFELEGEAGHASFERFSPEEVQALNMPAFYKEAIKRAIDVNKAGAA